MTRHVAAAKSKRGRDAHARGRLTEWMCLLRLRLTGWRIVAHRLVGKRGSGLGEVDIVAKRGRVLAFIEVKARGSTTAALESITAPQRERIQNAAATFLATHPRLADHTVRFDAMIVGQTPLPRHIPDAWRLY